MSAERPIDLRDHFHIWERCGNTRFFRRDPENPWQITYLNPLDGVLVTLRMTSVPPQEPRYELTLRDARRVNEKAVAEAHAAEPPWVKRSVYVFFRLQMIGVLTEEVRAHHHQRTAGDAELRHILSTYTHGDERYLREGRSPAGDKPMLEEMLEAVYRTITKLHGAIADYGRNLSRADAMEALADAGILEC